MADDDVQFNADAFRKLIASVERRPEERFDMGNWIRVGRGCGTVCCAFGSFAEDHGAEYDLRLEIDEAERCLEAIDHPEESEYGTAARVFGITREDAWFLFNPYDYRSDKLKSKAAVLRRLWAFLDERVA